jgi:hypothetical protein
MQPIVTLPADAAGLSTILREGRLPVLPYVYNQLSSFEKVVEGSGQLAHYVTATILLTESDERPPVGAWTILLASFFLQIRIRSFA